MPLRDRQAVVWLPTGYGGSHLWQPCGNATALGQFGAPTAIALLNARANTP